MKHTKKQIEDLKFHHHQMSLKVIKEGFTSLDALARNYGNLEYRKEILEKLYGVFCGMEVFDVEYEVHWKAFQDREKLWHCHALAQKMEDAA